MPKLILIKHAPPEVDPAKPPEQWHLSPRGLELCEPLAQKLRQLAPRVVISSRETKAIETAAAVAQRLGVESRVAEGLHEHDRSNVPHMRSAEFISMIELFFRRPDELVLGKETAHQAEARFREAVAGVMEDRADENVVIVSHGAVIALYLAPLMNCSAFELWRRLGLPSFAVIDVSQSAVDRIVENVA